MRKIRNFFNSQNKTNFKLMYNINNNPHIPKNYNITDNFDAGNTEININNRDSVFAHSAFVSPFVSPRQEVAESNIDELEERAEPPISNTASVQSTSSRHTPKKKRVSVERFGQMVEYFEATMAANPGMSKMNYLRNHYPFKDELTPDGFDSRLKQLHRKNPSQPSSAASSTQKQSPVLEAILLEYQRKKLELVNDIKDKIFEAGGKEYLKLNQEKHNAITMDAYYYSYLEPLFERMHEGKFYFTHFQDHVRNMRAEPSESPVISLSAPHIYPPAVVKECATLRQIFGIRNFNITGYFNDHVHVGEPSTFEQKVKICESILPLDDLLAFNLNRVQELKKYINIYAFEAWRQSNSQLSEVEIHALLHGEDARPQAVKECAILRQMFGIRNFNITSYFNDHVHGGEPSTFEQEVRFCESVLPLDDLLAFNLNRVEELKKYINIYAFEAWKQNNSPLSEGEIHALLHGR